MIRSIILFAALLLIVLRSLRKFQNLRAKGTVAFIGTYIMTKLLFICTGNICRSPIAEGLAPMIGAKHGHIVEAKSASTLGLRNKPADPHSVAVCKSIGIDISGHRSQAITMELVNWADYILVMERKHASHMYKHFPKASQDKVLELGSFASMVKIPDPIGSWRFTFRKTRKQIIKGLESFFQKLPKR